MFVCGLPLISAELSALSLPECVAVQQDCPAQTPANLSGALFVAQFVGFRGDVLCSCTMMSRCASLITVAGTKVGVELDRIYLILIADTRQDLHTIPGLSYFHNSLLKYMMGREFPILGAGFIHRNGITLLIT